MYWGSIEIMEYILGLYREEHGSYYLGFRVEGFALGFSMLPVANVSVSQTASLAKPTSMCCDVGVLKKGGP